MTHSSTPDDLVADSPASVVTSPSAPPPLPVFLSPRDLGAAIGVSESSVKRWADSGQLKLVRTRGGHRRIRLPEAIRFIQKQRHEVVRPELLGLPSRARQLARQPVHEIARTLSRFLQEGKLAEAHAALLHAFVEGVELVTIARDILQPALEQIGELWHHGPDGIAIEHAATEALLQSLHEIARLLPASDGPVALGGAPEWDHYQLPSLLASMALQQAGWRSTNLGARVPVAALLAAAARLQPKLIWLSLSHDEPRGAARAYIEVAAAGLQGSDALLAIGGRLSGDLKDARLPLDPQRVLFVDSLAQLQDLARSRSGPVK